ncbi:MAG: biotin synthase BioB, partial [Clostridia bacterium]
MTYTESCKEKVMNGKELTKKEALTLYEQPLAELCRGADEIREHFCADRFDFCAIINGKSGRCSENCRFCAQSTHNKNQTVCFPLLSA